MKCKRRNRGTMMPFMMATMAFVTAVGFLFFCMILYFGSAVEVRNGTDAGALNVGHRVTSIRVRAQGPLEEEFSDVAGEDGSFGLDNINRVWSGALLAAINVEAMRKDGQATMLAEQHATLLFDAAKSISDRLTSQLSDPHNLQQLFEEVSKRNSARMSRGEAVAATTDGQWRTSYVDRGVESNITLKPDQLPAGFDASALQLLPGDNDSGYLPGYTELRVLGRTFGFVPFKRGVQPHLLSGREFGSNDGDKGGLPPVAVPNAFSAAGENGAPAKPSGNNGVMTAGGITAVAFSVANPQKTFQLKKPHGFIRIRFAQPRVKVTVNNLPQEQTYPMTSISQRISFPVPAGKGTLVVTARVGNEYNRRTLNQAIFAVEGSNYERTRDFLVQRGKEIDPDFSLDDLIKLLDGQMLVDGDLEYFILPSGDSHKLTVSPRSRLSAAWIHPDSPPDGSGKLVAHEFSANKPNDATQVLVGPGVLEYGLLEVDLAGEHTWIPGSGFGGCLGELSIERNTEIFATGYVR